MSSAPTSFYEFEVLDIKKEPVQLSKYKNKVVLVVNVASGCMLTPQYKDLEELYKKYNDKGLEIIGFPCNDFKGQEPDSEEVIHEKMCSRFHITFPLFAKIKLVDEDGNVLPDCEPVYKFLLSNDPTKSGKIEWNFTKFVINREGKVVGKYLSKDLPNENNDADPLFNALKQ